MNNGVQLICYPDSLGGDLCALNRLLSGRLSGLFKGGVHILPPFPSSGDRGFAPKTYFEIDPAFGTWSDIETIGETHDVVLDLMVNHISRRSEYFLDFAKRGRRSRWADLFVTVDKVWPDSRIPSEEIAMVACRKPGEPFSEVRIEESGAVERVWSTFGSMDWSEQIDLDVQSRSTRDLFASVLAHFARRGVKMTRLDAMGYVIKKRGTSCFMVEPEIFEFLEWLKETADRFGIDLLPEIHARQAHQKKVAALGYYVYDFVLPALLLHSFLSRSSDRLREYLRSCPRRQFTTLDSHDGIPIRPDMEGILTAEESKRIVESCVARGANVSRIRPNNAAVGDLDAHQVNCTYFDALGRDSGAYIAARAVQFFAPGIPQVYYVGLLAGENDYLAARRTGVGRAVNRHDFSLMEIETALEKPVVQRLLSLIRFRNTHASFDGAFSVAESDKRSISLKWRNGDIFSSLDLSFTGGPIRIRYSGENGVVVERNF